MDGQHIREYPRATAHSQDEVLQLSVKQYIPKDNRNPKPGDITIIASHANGFVKVILTLHSLTHLRIHNSHPRLTRLTNHLQNSGTI